LANICRSRTARNQPGIGQGEKDVWFSDYGVWAETSQDEKRASKEESVNELLLLLLFHLSHLFVIIFI
jgi:hypothetical protein